MTTTTPATTKVFLGEAEIPTHWYNIVPDLPFQLDPPLNPATMEPVGPLDRTTEGAGPDEDPVAVQFNEEDIRAAGARRGRGPRAGVEVHGPLERAG